MNHPPATPENHGPDEALPPEVVRGMRVAFGVTPDIPAHVDAALTLEFRARQSRSRSGGWLSRRFVMTAAVCALSFSLVYIAVRQRPLLPPTASGLAQGDPIPDARLAFAEAEPPRADHAADIAGAAPADSVTESMGRRLEAHGLPGQPMRARSGVEARTAEVLNKASPGRGDLNADGRVDIHDAFALALTLGPSRDLAGQARDARTPLDPSLDITNDGVIDDADALAIARHAVRLATSPPAALGAAPEPPREIHLSECCFEAVDITLDAGESRIAAYQVEILAVPHAELDRPASPVMFVGFEGGGLPDLPAFAKAPVHDPRSMGADRTVLAAFSTTTPLPPGPHRVARLHVQRGPGDRPIEYRVLSVTAAGPDGVRLEDVRASAALVTPLPARPATIDEEDPVK
ncbi:MAG: hypothetical protein HRU70_05980 [Phycisphaeraceae bacterium]|nr:MAG: hypothetical protein HRU70_05980 [Phycisphaeraceae bacterium]